MNRGYKLLKVNDFVVEEEEDDDADEGEEEEKEKDEADEGIEPDDTAGEEGAEIG